MDLPDSFFLTTPIWARIPGLPLEFWHEEIFKGIASSFGELVALDNATVSRTNLQSARLYVKVADLNLLPEKVELISKLGKKTQKIIFEDLPNSCYACKKQGHLVKNCPSKSKKHPNSVPDGKKTKIQQKKVWKPKEDHCQEQKNNEDSKASLAKMDNEPSFEKAIFEKDGHGIQSNTIMSEQRIDDLADLSKQIVIYQRIEDQRRDLEDKTGLEEGEILAEDGYKLEMGDLFSQSREIQVLSQANFVRPLDGPPPLDVVKEKGENSKHKLNQRKRANIKNITKGVETRSSKIEQQTKMNHLASTLEKPGKRAEQHAKVKPDVGPPEKSGRRTIKKTRELESMHNIADGRQATILDFTPKK